MTNSNGIHKGHRQRMRRKFLQNSARFFDTYELLEMLLYHVVPYRDTNPTAKLLLARFGSVDAVFRASKEELCEVDGVGDRVAEYITSLGRLTELDLIAERDECISYDDYDRLGRRVVEYFNTKVSTDYAVVAFALDNSMHITAIKQLYEYDFESGAVRADAFLEFALSNRAAVVATAHIHRRGPAFPTVGDVESGKLVQSALLAAGIFHAEHYLVCGDAYVGIMNNLNNAFKQYSAIKRFIESREAKGNA